MCLEDLDALLDLPLDLQCPNPRDLFPRRFQGLSAPATCRLQAKHGVSFSPFPSTPMPYEARVLDLGTPVPPLRPLVAFDPRSYPLPSAVYLPVLSLHSVSVLPPFPPQSLALSY